MSAASKPRRRPVHLVADDKRPEGRDVIWAAIRKLRTFTREQLRVATRINDRTIESYLQGLTKAGYLSRTEQVRKANVTGVVAMSACEYQLIRDVGVEAPRVTRSGEAVTQGAGREAMWMQMRILKSFTLLELQAVASVTKAIKLAEVKDYCMFLARAGYLRRETAGTARGKTTRYHTVPARYSGPRAPMIQRIKQVWDPNLGRVVWPVEGNDGR